jgi:valyl-tRNA synthetase
MGEQTQQQGRADAGPGARTELPKQYRPTDHEGRIREAWERSGAFHPDPGRVLRGEARPYAIVIPPPNVTDRLHLGHALNNTLQDVLVRAHRMMGFETLWMPGTDHAGIATQTVVEKRVLKETGKKRMEFSREEFVAKIQAFKDEYEATITGQLKAMGCSCDWERQRFTMDEVCARAVNEAFFRLFRDGLIYRGKRLVNWDPVTQTALADDEVEMEEVDGKFYYLRYPLVHSVVRGSDPGAGQSVEASRGERDEGQPAVPVTWSDLRARGYPVPAGADYGDENQAFVTVATTRPETYLGDTAVGVNPRDQRAGALRGLLAELPLVGRIIPIIEDDYVVMPKAMAERLGDAEAAADPKAEFATGFLKVTPAHDPNDYELGRKHDLPLINVMAPDASISDKHGWTDVGDAHIFVGKGREEARKLVVKEFQARGLVEEIKPYRHSIGHSYRSHAAIEPYLSDQWYVKVTDLTMRDAALRSLADDQRERVASVAAEVADLVATGHKGRSAGDGELRFYPDRYARTYENWNVNLRDWCISRQLWWGHRIPVWTATFGGSTQPDQVDFRNAMEILSVAQAHSVRVWSIGDRRYRMVPADLSDHTRLNAAEREFLSPSSSTLGAEIKDLKAAGLTAFERDPDVLDTWFSSALWPMSTMGWPQETDLLKAFNPTDVLCTAREIITLWVSRMVMFNRYFMPEGWARAHELSKDGRGNGPLPFRDVFIHAMIQDEQGRKMSKSLGNGVDPLDIISSHGADAMRFTLVQMTTHTQDVRMPVVKDQTTGRNTSPKFDFGRNFCNKIWNAARFAIGILESEGDGKRHTASGKPEGLADRWMLSRLAAGVAEVERALKEYSFSEYAQAVYDLLWRDFCDWYLEAIKPTVSSSPAQRAVLAHALESIVRLLHPITPFITEAIWERLREIETEPVQGIDLGAARIAGLLATAGWPRVDSSLRDKAAEADFERVRGLVTAIREVRAQHNVPPKRRITLHAGKALSPEAESLVKTLATMERVTTDRAAGPAVPFNFDTEQYVLSDLKEAVDVGAEAGRLEKVIGDKRKSIQTLQGRLNNPGYAEKAPPAMVQQTRDQLAKDQTEFEAATAALRALKGGA